MDILRILGRSFIALFDHGGFISFDECKTLLSQRIGCRPEELDRIRPRVVVLGNSVALSTLYKLYDYHKQHNKLPF